MAAAGRKTARRTRGKNRVHSVSGQLSFERLTRTTTAITLDITGVGGKLGTLEIGRGSLMWTGKNRKSTKRIRWAKFAEIMNELAYGDPGT